MIPGPNVVVKGDVDEVAGFISSKFGIKLEKAGNEYHAKLTDKLVNVGGQYPSRLKGNILLCVAAHPTLKHCTLIIGAYLGS